MALVVAFCSSESGGKATTETVISKPPLISGFREELQVFFVEVFNVVERRGGRGRG